jgi:beta-lactamase regulating signal transducer with metallopeptidase domain
MSPVEFIFRLVFEVSWRMACVISLFMALRLAFRGQVSPRLLYWAWIAAAILLLIPFSLPAKWSPFNLIRIEHRDAFMGNESLAAEGPRSGSPLATSSQILPRQIQDKRGPVWPIPSLVETAAYTWGAGVLVLLFGRILAYRRFSLRLKATPDTRNHQLVSNAAKMAADLGLGEVRILATDLVGAPALHGILKPKILFPPDLLEKLAAPEVRFIISHELCHHRRHDLVSQALIQAAQVVHWFNPLVWMAGTAARNDCELACDEHVVCQLGSESREAYGAALLRILSMAKLSATTPLGVGIAESKVQIKRRIQMIMSNQTSSMANSCLGWALLILVVGLGATRELHADQPSGTAQVTAAAAPTPVTATAAITSEAPEGWWKNGSQVSSYVVGVDREQMHDGQPGAYVKSIVPSIAGFGGMMQMCKAEKFIGKRLRYSGWMKTADTNSGGAHLWFRVDGKGNGVMLQFDNMDGRQVTGTTDWQHYSIVLDVPADSTALAFGFFINGTGQAWVSGLKMEEVGLGVPSTNIAGKKDRILPDAPVNLGFQ